MEDNYNDSEPSVSVSFLSGTVLTFCGITALLFNNSPVR